MLPCEKIWIRLKLGLRFLDPKKSGLTEVGKLIGHLVSSINSVMQSFSKKMDEFQDQFGYSKQLVEETEEAFIESIC